MRYDVFDSSYDTYFNCENNNKLDASLYISEESKGKGELKVSSNQKILKWTGTTQELKEM